MVEIREIASDDGKKATENPGKAQSKKKKAKSKQGMLNERHETKKPKLEMLPENIPDEEMEDEESDTEAAGCSNKPDIYLPTMPLGEDEELVCDPRAYLLHHQVQTGYPCLCFDVIPDSKCSDNKRANFDSYLVAGTQAERKLSNRILVLKLENLKVKTPKEESDNDESESDLSSNDSDEDECDEKPQLYASAIRHSAIVNRIKFSASDNLGNLPLVAAWSEEGKVGIYDVSAALFALNNRESTVADKKSRKNAAQLPKDVKADEPQLFCFEGHQTEGFALDWSPLIGGQLLSGDCDGKIHLLIPRGSTSWTYDSKRPFESHESSVEDLQWSPTEKSVFCSCSADSSIRIWDVRSANRKSQLAIMDAHSSDVNVVSWNRVETSLLLSGGDDGALKVWDFRNTKKPVAYFQHHSAPITSVQWCPHDSSVFAASGEDDQLTLWDCSVEPDDANESAATDDSSAHVPPQLLFIHMGQKEIKELRWYPHSEGVVLSVASTGLDIFRTISV